MEVHHHVVLGLILLFTIISQHIHEALLCSEAPDSLEQSIEAISSTSVVTLNATEMIEEGGYTAEEHHVTTEDGYILTINRIKKVAGQVVFIMHGLLNSADDWLTAGKDALPFVLAEAGYDVFLGNARGNKYSRKHIRLSPCHKVFWNFSWHEIGFYDLPAMIDHALKTSSKTQLTYIGQSQGTTVFFVMASLKPEYNDKVSLMISMATIAWLFHIRTPVIKSLVPFRNQEAFIADSLGIYELLPYSGIFRFITTRLCPSSAFAEFVCASVLFTAYGFDYEQMNYTQFTKEISHVPAGSSIKQVLHYAQLIKNKDFRQFDHKSKTANIKAYGSEVPPSYPMHKIKVPIAIMHAENDWISSYEDVKIAIGKLPNVIDIYIVNNKKWNHQDYLWGKDAKSMVYNRVLELISNVTFNAI